MNYITSLLAFIAVITLLSVIVATVVEAFIGLFSMRAAGLRKLLKTYYREAVVPRLPEGSRSDALRREADVFARRMTENPSRQNNAFDARISRFKDLTTRQLVEQLARTDAGKALLGLPDALLRPKLDALAYEYDRYRDGAREFFTQRTRTASTFVAIALAFALNVDALRLYQGLLVSPAAQEAAVAFMLSEEGKEKIQASISARQAPSDPGREASADDPIRESVREVVATVGELGAMTLPIGYSQYPMCSEYSLLLGQVDAKHAAFDRRCADIIQERVRARTAHGGSSIDWVKDGPRLLAMRFSGNNLLNTLQWLFSVLIAGGMIGLGAPFWYGAFQRLAALAPIAAAASALMRKPSESGESRPKAKGRRSDEEATDPDDLVFAMRSSGGQSPDRKPSTTAAHTTQAAGSSPVGERVGPGSSQRIEGAGTSATDPAGPGSLSGIRRLRG